MASKKREGSVADITVAILRDIRDEIRELRADAARELGEVRAEMTRGFETSARGFEAVTARLENMRDFSGERWRDHERRIRRLETRGAAR